MPAITTRLPRRLHVAVVLLAAVVLFGVQGFTSRPAHASAFDCVPGEALGPLALTISGPAGTGTTQPAGQFSKLTVSGAGLRIEPRQYVCNYDTYSETVTWSYGFPFGFAPPGARTTFDPAEQSQNPTFVKEDPGVDTYVATVAIADLTQRYTVWQISASLPVTYTSGPHGTAVTASPGATALQAVQFTGTTSDVMPVYWQWDFGDLTGTVNAGATVAHTYAAAGDYTVTVTASDLYGGPDTATLAVHVVATPLTPAFTVAPDSVPLGGVVQVDGGGSTTDPEATITGYAWDFGDGATATGGTASHIYTTSGTHTIAETVTDSLGRTATTTHEVTVTDAPGTPPPSAGHPPVATWTASPDRPVAASPVTFDGSASTATDGSIVDYAWNFGDGSTGSGLTPKHTYTGADSYPVTLTVTDSTGQTASHTDSVVVADAAPTAAFTPPSGAVGDQLAFDGTESADPDGTIAAYAWDFGDGTTSTEAKPSHAYGMAQTYQVTLTVTDSGGKTDSVTSPVTVGAAPITAAFVPGTSAPTVGTPVPFDASGSGEPGGTITGYSWTFGDGGTATGMQPTHTYKAAGTFSATLTVTDAAGNTASVTAVVSPHWPATDLAVAVGGSVPKAGQYTYRVTVKNLGHNAAHGIVLTNALDPTQTLASTVKAPTGLACGGVPTGSTGTITCKASAVLAAGSSWVVTFTVTQPPIARARQVTETSVVREANPDGVTRNNTARLTTAV